MGQPKEALMRILLLFIMVNVAFAGGDGGCSSQTLPEIHPQVPSAHEEIEDAAPDTSVEAPRDHTTLIPGTEVRPLALASETAIRAGKLCGSGIISSLGIAAGDLDGDGWNDLILPNCDELLILRGRGDLTFEEPVVLSPGTTPEEFAISVYLYDADRDGQTDVIWMGTNGVRFLLNQGELVFEPVDGNLGITPRTGLPTSISIVDFNGDRRTDLFVAYTSPDFGMDVLTDGYADSDFLQPALYLGNEDGTFTEEPLPTTERWYGLHALATYQGEIILLNDFGHKSLVNSTVYRWTENEVVAIPFPQIFHNDPDGPMGGVWEDLYAEAGTAELVITDTGPIKAYTNVGSDWFESAGSYGLITEGISWSILVDDTDLDGNTDTILTQADFPIFHEVVTQDRMRSREIGTFLFTADGTKHFTSEVIGTTNAIGATLADLDGDGLREVVALEVDVMLPAWQEQRIQIFSAKSTQARVELTLDMSCAGATVRVGTATRHFIPYGNTGSYGNGTLALTFPIAGETEAEVTPLWGEVFSIAIIPNTRQEITCN